MDIVNSWCAKDYLVLLVCQFTELCTVLCSVLGKVKDFLGEIAKGNQKLQLDTQV